MLTLALALIGFTAVVAQVALMRELLVVFQGNELTLAFTLAGWLLWTAFGSGVLGRLATRTRSPRRLMAALEALLAVALPATVYAIRASRGVFQPVPGELLGPGPMLATSLAALSVFCALSGCLFAAGTRAWAMETAGSAGEATGRVYLWEATGAVAGGVLASLVFIRRLDSMEIATLVGLANLLAAAALAIRSRTRRLAAMAALVAAWLAVMLPLGNPWLVRGSLQKLWSGFQLIATENSAYGNLAVVEAGGSRSLFENGLAVFSPSDPAAAEEAVHYALLEHPAPRSLLLVGGGINGSVAEALKHPSLERLDYVELDPAILNVAARHFPEQWAPLRDNPRVRTHTADGRLFLKTTDLKFDVIIVNLPDPQTAQLNRFYTLEFFRQAARKLTPAGLLSFHLTSSENYIGGELAAFLQCVNRTLRAAFVQVMAIPGPEVHFFATNRRMPLTRDPQELIARLKARNLATNYVSEYYLPFRLARDRVLDLDRQIRPAAHTPLNRDFAPAAYYFDMVLWSSRFGGGTLAWLEAASKVSFGAVSVAAGIALALLGTVLARGRAPQRAAAGFAAGTMGFTLMGLQLLLLLGFQAVYGYVYEQLAMVIGAFMGGMAVGSWMAARTAGSDLRRLARIGWLAVASGVLLVAALAALASVESPAGLFLASQAVFPALAVLAGALGGYQFPIAGRIFFGGGEAGRSGMGALYALDLAGACAGALLMGAWLIPVYGFFKTAVLMTVVNLAPAWLASRTARRTRTP